MTIARKVAICVLRGYQFLISPLLGPNCRFHPSCSHYACDAIRHHGLARGCYLAAARLLRCHPWAAWGDDPVPERFTFQPWRIKNAGFDGEG